MSKLSEPCVSADQPAIDDLAMVDLVSDHGVILDCDARQAAWLGHSVEDLVGADWSLVYSRSARKDLRALLAAGASGPVPRRLRLRDAEGRSRPVSALIEIGRHRGEGLTLRLFKWREAEFARAADLSEGKAVLIDILNASDDPCWCIEYAEPVDLSAPEPEIVRQMFENRRHWRFCNPAMGRFYRLPGDQDLNDRPVREIFDRNPENEDFALFLLRNNFDVVRALSRDTRYDGTTIDVENDVRGLIRNNCLFRMWGTVRDVSKQLRRSDELRKQVGDLELALAAVPEALALVDEQGIVIFANAAAETLFGLSPDLIVGRPLDRLVRNGASFEALAVQTRESPIGALHAPVPVMIAGRDGAIGADLNARCFQTRGRPFLAVSFRNGVTAHSGDLLHRGRAGQ